MIKCKVHISGEIQDSVESLVIMGMSMKM